MQLDGKSLALMSITCKKLEKEGRLLKSRERLCLNHRADPFPPLSHPTASISFYCPSIYPSGGQLVPRLSRILHPSPRGRNCYAVGAAELHGGHDRALSKKPGRDFGKVNQPRSIPSSRGRGETRGGVSPRERERESERTRCVSLPPVLVRVYIYTKLRHGRARDPKATSTV